MPCEGSYLINLGSYDEELLEKSYAALVEELRRCEKLGIELYNIHPGHHNKVLRYTWIQSWHSKLH